MATNLPNAPNPAVTTSVPIINVRGGFRGQLIAQALSKPCQLPPSPPPKNQSYGNEEPSTFRTQPVQRTIKNKTDPAGAFTGTETQEQLQADFDAARFGLYQGSELERVKPPRE